MSATILLCCLTCVTDFRPLQYLPHVLPAFRDDADMAMILRSTSFDVLQTVGDFTLANHFALAYVGLQLDLLIRLKPNADGSSVVVTHDGEIVERAVLHAGVKNMSATLASLLAVKDSVKGLQLGTVIGSPVGCVFSEIFLANITYLNVTIRGVQHPMLSQFVSQGVDDLFNGIADTAFLLYEEIGLGILPGLIQSSVRQLLNDAIVAYLSDPANAICPPCTASASMHRCVVTPGDIAFLDFMATREIVGVAWMLNQALGVDNLNMAIGSVTKAESGKAGSFSRHGFLVDSTTVVEDGDETCITCSRLGKIVLQVSELRVVGLDTFADMALLQPTSAFTIHNSLTLAAPIPAPTDPIESAMWELEGSWTPSTPAPTPTPVPSKNPGPLGVAVDIGIQVHGKQLRVHDNFTLSLDLHGVRFVLDLLLMVDADKLWGIRMHQLLDSSKYLQTLAAARPEEFELNFGSFELGVDCGHGRCSSPLLPVLAANLRSTDNIVQLTDAVNRFLSRVGNHFTKDPKVQEHYELMLAQYSDDALAIRLNHSGCVDVASANCKLRSAAMQCDLDPVFMDQNCRLSCGLCANPTRPAPSSHVGLTVGAVVGLIAAIFGVSICCLRSCSRKTAANPMQSMRKITERSSRDSSRRSRLSRASSTDISVGLLDAQLLKPSSPVPQSGTLLPPIEVSLEPAGSLFSSAEVPTYWRYGVPLCLLINICLFLSGHLSIGAAVDVDIHFMGDHVRLDSIVEFSLGHSLKDMYNAGAMVLFVFIGSFSGVWPYTKLLLLMFCWFAPVGCLSASRRGSLLAKLDYLGTWSLIDLYVLVMCMLGFHLQIASPTDLNFLPPQFYLIKLMVTPVWGLYGFMLAVVSSLVINFVCLHYHRLDVASVHGNTAIAKRQVAMVSALSSGSALGSSEHVAQREALKDHIFEGNGLGYRFGFTRVGKRGTTSVT
eukprot:COSAG01_NODE_1286_length_10900_cov_26.719100_5_plen_945_part_00